MYSEIAGPNMKLKQVPLTKKYICLTILAVNLVYTCSEIYLSNSLILLQINNS